MSKPSTGRSFRDLVSSYRAVFFDAYGVLKNHEGTLPGLDETFAFLERQDIAFQVLTNDASRAPEQLASAYRQAGLTAVTAEKNRLVRNPRLPPHPSEGGKRGGSRTSVRRRRRVSSNRTQSRRFPLAS